MTKTTIHTINNRTTMINPSFHVLIDLYNKKKHPLSKKKKCVRSFLVERSEHHWDWNPSFIIHSIIEYRKKKKEVVEMLNTKRHRNWAGHPGNLPHDGPACGSDGTPAPAGS